MKVNVSGRAKVEIIWVTFRKLFTKMCFGVIFKSQGWGYVYDFPKEISSLCHRGFTLNQNMLLESLQSTGGRFAVEQRWMACLTTLPAQCVV